MNLMTLLEANTSENDNVLDVPYTVLNWDRFVWPDHFSVDGVEGTFNFYRSQYNYATHKEVYREYRNSTGQTVRVRRWQ